jgi:alpha-N-arabinofuranosidase
MANMAPVINTRGPLFVHQSGLIRRTTFHVLAMYANLLAGRVADTFTLSDRYPHGGQSVPVFDGIATCDSGMSGWRLALVNRDPEQPLSLKVILAGQPLEGVYPATILCGDSPDAYNDVDRPSRVVPVKAHLEFHSGCAELPPHSLSILEVG